MISAVNSNLNQLTNELVTAKQNTKISTSTEGKEKVDTSLFDSAPAPRTDTLEISPEGYAALAAQTSTETSSDASTQYTADGSTALDATEGTDGPKGAGTPPPSRTAATDETSSTDSTETSSSKNLSSYSEDELDQMVDDGSITETEKNTELTRRAMEEEMEAQNSATTNASESTENTDNTNNNKPPRPEDGTVPPRPPRFNEEDKGNSTTEISTDSIAAAMSTAATEDDE